MSPLIVPLFVSFSLAMVPEVRRMPAWPAPPSIRPPFFIAQFRADRTRPDAVTRALNEAGCLIGQCVDGAAAYQAEAPSLPQGCRHWFGRVFHRRC